MSNGVITLVIVQPYFIMVLQLPIAKDVWIATEMHENFFNISK